jgi:hypothetical protein
VKIIDFGAGPAWPGITDMGHAISRGSDIPSGTGASTPAPSTFLGEYGERTRRTFFSLGVITYQMLSGRCRTAPRCPRARTQSAQRQLR